MNEKAVIREIKKSRYGSIIWQRKGEYHYISNTNWAIKIKKMPSSILGLLVSIFGQIPQKGRSLRYYYHRNTIKTDGPKIDAVYKSQSKKYTVLNTPLSAHLSNSKTNVTLLSYEKGVIYINSDFCSMIGKGESSYFTDGKDQPVICINEECEFLLLPIRNDGQIEHIIKGLSERIGA